MVIEIKLMIEHKLLKYYSKLILKYSIVDTQVFVLAI